MTAYTTRTLRTDNTARVALTVTTHLTDREAAQVCARIRGNNFAGSLVSDFSRYGRLFPNKLCWLHKLALEQIKREEAARPAPMPTFEEAFEAAMERHLNAESQIGEAERFEMAEQEALENRLDAELRGEPVTTPRPVAVAPVVEPVRYPKIADFLTPVSARLKSGASVTVTWEGYTVEIKRAGAKSRTPGAFFVTDGRPYGSNTLYGRIDTDGTFTAYRGMNTPAGTHVEAALADMERDPAEFCAVMGKRQGRCCFCTLPLTDDVSVSFGYGGTCAKNFGLPYGKRELNKRQEMRCAASVA